MTTKPPVIVDVAIIGGCILAQITVVRVGTGSYPPPWVFFAACGAAVVAWTIGRSAALRRARDE